MQHNISGANKKHDYYFSGMCVCNDCGSGMSGIIIKRKVKEKGYDCSRYRQYSTKACHCHEIKEKDILIHLKEFFKFTKQKYLKEIKDIKIEIKQENKTNDKFKLQNKLNILNEEYKMLINQKVKELAFCNNSMQREIIENTYKELEKEKDNANEKLLEIRDAIIEMVLVSIISSTEEDSYTIFEILNARGQELEQYELLKNYIMRYIEPVENRDSAKEKWEEMERELGAYIKKFINQYVWHKYGIIDGMSTYRIIQKKTKGTNVNNLLDDILVKAKYYCKFIKPTIGDDGNCLDYEFRIYSFFKSKRQEQFRPLLLSLLHQRELGKLSESLYKQTLEYLYNFFVCHTIIGKEKSNNLRDTIIEYACTLESDYSDEKLLEFGGILKKKIPSYEWFEMSFNNLGWSNHTEIFRNSKDKERVKLTLEIIEKFVSQRFDITEFTIEHILPDSQGEANAHIGNMIPLESRLNGLCKDKKLEEKYDLYEQSNFKYSKRDKTALCWKRI